MSETILPDTTTIQEPLSVDDNGASLTIDAGSLPLPTGAATAALQLANSHDVTIDNAAGASAVNIQDGGNTITVDGTVTATAAGDHTVVGKAADGVAVSGNPVLIAGQDGTNVQSLKTDTTGELQVDVLTLPALVAGAANIGDVDVLTVPAPLSTTGGGTEATALRVTLANDSTGLVSIDDNAGSITVDALTGASSIQIQGTAAHGAPAVGSPLYVAGRASTAVPTDVGADGDAAALWLNRNGLQVVSAIPGAGLNADPYTLLPKTAQYTTTQTSTVLVAGGASERIIVDSILIGVGGTVAGTLQVYFGTGAYVRGTDDAIFDHEFAPSATLKPGAFLKGPFRAGALGDDILVTTSAAINPLTITVWYYILAV